MPARKCDVCGQSPATRVAYGYPGPDAIEEARRGEVILGGCVMGIDPARWLCPRCASRREDLADVPERAR